VAVDSIQSWYIAQICRALWRIEGGNMRDYFTVYYLAGYFACTETAPIDEDIVIPREALVLGVILKTSFYTMRRGESS